MPRSIQNEVISSRNFLGLEAGEKPLSVLAGINPPPWVSEGPIYEVFIRNFSTAGTLAGVREKIPYLKDLGIKTIWLMPIHPIGRRGRKGRSGSPYAIRDHQAVNPQYGDKQDLRELVNAVHAADLRLIIDLVINHGAIDHVCTRTRPAMFLHDRQGRFTRKVAGWSDVIDFNYTNPHTRKYMREIMSYWIQEFDIDGYRCDVAGMVPLDFWEESVEKIMKLKSDLYLLAEWQNPHLHEHAFHSTYDWVAYWVLEEIYQQKRPAPDILHWLKERAVLYPQNALSLCFTENHDFPRTSHVFGKNSFYPFSAMIFAMSGIPLLYNGQEHGAAKICSLFEKDEIQWVEANKNIFNFYKQLIQIRKQNPALAVKKSRVLKNDHPTQVVTFMKSAGNNELLVMLNFSPERQNIKVGFSAQYHNYIWQNLLNTKITRNGKELTNIELKPYEVLFWKRETSHRA
jgi:cyclomaltodextrinase